MEPTVLRFLGLLAAEIAFSVVAAASVLVLVWHATKSGKLTGTALFVFGVFSSASSVLFLSLFLWILTSNWYVSILGSVLLIAILLTFLTEFLWIIFGKHNAPWSMQLFWREMSLNRLYPKTSKTIQAIGLLPVIVYPIYVGIGFFGEKFHSPNWDSYAFRATLLLFFGGGILLSAPRAINTMSSRNISEEVRSRIFIGQLAQSGSLLILGSLYIWTLDPSATEVSSSGGIFATITPIVVYATVGYVLVFLVIPYLIGHFRNKAWIEELEEARDNIVEEILKGVKSPLLQRATGALVKGEESIDQGLHAVEREKSYQITEEASEEADPRLEINRNAAQASIQDDPRFVYSRKLKDLRQQVNDCLQALGSAGDEKQQREVLKQFEDAVTEKEGEKGEAARSRPAVLVGITFVVLAITNPAVTLLIKKVAADFGIAIE